MIADYFSNQPLYDERQFRRRFRMRKHAFIRNVNTLSLHYRFLQRNPNACMRQGATAFQKCTAVIRMLAYGFVVQIDEYLKFGATTSKKCLTLTHFVDGIITQFSAEYLRKPSTKNLQRLLREGEDRGFLGMIGSNGCMHWEWKLVRKGCIMEDLEQRL